MHKVLQVPRDKISTVWETISPLIFNGLAVAPDVTVSGLADGLVDGSIQMWIVTKDAEATAAFLTSIERDAQEWVLSLYAMSGRDAKDWVGDCHAAMDVFAQAEGCARVRMCGRKAWQRILPEEYRVTSSRGDHLVYERVVG